MASQEATSRPKVGKTMEHRTGTITELLAITTTPTTLSVLCGDRFDSVQAFCSGDFSVSMVRVKSATNSPVISVLTCMVGDHQWMLAKDSLVAAIGERRFVFGLPGFFYGMEIGEGEHEQKYETLEGIFGRFCAYQDFTHVEGPDESTNNPENNPWIAGYNKIQNLTNWRASTFGAPKSTPESTNSDLTLYNKMERAVRTSAVVKLLIHTLLIGALHPSKHIHICPANTVRTVAMPTMWVVSDLLIALETNRTTANRAVMPGDHDGTAWWHVNVEGVMFLLRLMRAFGAKTAMMADRKRKRDDKLELHGNGRTKKMSSCGSMSQMAGLRMGTCGN